MRKLEILSLKWTNLNNNLITTDATNSKSKRIKHIPVCNELAFGLKKQKLVTGYQDYVFLTPMGENYKRTDSLNSFKRANLRDVAFLYIKTYIRQQGY